MIFADKLVQLRKKSGWSQEELAEQMKVTRQSVSKWEGAQAIPDLGKIVRLSELFGVSTDYLLKDDMEETEQIDMKEEVAAVRQVSMEEANSFLAAKAATAKPIAFATFLCILSPICLFLLAVLSETPRYGITENMAGGIGMIVLIGMIAAAVSIFISSGSKTSKYLYLEKEIIETQYGVTGMVKERQEQYRGTYTRSNIAGTVLCIVAIIPLFVGAIINEDSDLLLICMLSGTFVIVGIGVMQFIRSGIIWASFDKLLQEGDYARQKKEKQSVRTAISLAYWLIATAIYLGYSLLTNNWDYSWIMWVVAGVLYPALLAILDVFSKSSK